MRQDLPAGVQTVTARIDYPDALPADNEASAIIDQGSSFGLRIPLVTDYSKNPVKALSVLPGAQVTVMSAIEASSAPLADFDMVVYDRSTPQGSLADLPTLFVAPPGAGILSDQRHDGEPEAAERAGG